MSTANIKRATRTAGVTNKRQNAIPNDAFEYLVNLILSKRIGHSLL